MFLVITFIMKLLAKTNLYKDNFALYWSCNCPAVALPGFCWDTLLDILQLRKNFIKYRHFWEKSSFC